MNRRWSPMAASGLLCVMAAFALAVGWPSTVQDGERSLVATPGAATVPGSLTIVNGEARPASDLYLALSDEQRRDPSSGYFIGARVRANAPHCGAPQAAQLLGGMVLDLS